MCRRFDSVPGHHFFSISFFSTYPRCAFGFDVAHVPGTLGSSDPFGSSSPRALGIRSRLCRTRTLAHAMRKNMPLACFSASHGLATFFCETFFWLRPLGDRPRSALASLVLGTERTRFACAGDGSALASLVLHVVDFLRRGISHRTGYFIGVISAPI